MQIGLQQLDEGPSFIVPALGNSGDRNNLGIPRTDPGTRHSDAAVLSFHFSRIILR